MHILVNDFIGGVLDRGIPLYVRNLIYGLKEEGFRVTVVRAPTLFRKLPMNLFYLISVLVEQFVLPVIGFVLQPDITIYPYNSIAILDIFTGRGRVVVHDLEILNRPLSHPSALYCRACYRILKRFGYPVFTIADLIKQNIAASGYFDGCPISVLPNTFYVFENLVRMQLSAVPAAKSILLCTGSTPNKDLAGVVAEYLPIALAAGFHISVLGLHKTSDLAVLKPLSSFIVSRQLTLCGQLSDREVVKEYRSNDIVWVHSQREGFGRCVVEGRLAGKRVVCSAIPEFMTLKDEEVYPYENSAVFAKLLTELPPTTAKMSAYTGYSYQELLRDAIRSGL